MVTRDAVDVITYNAIVYIPSDEVTVRRISAISEIMNRLLVQRSLLSLDLHLPSLLSGM